MSIVLWILQLLLALAFVAVGSTHAFWLEKAKLRPRMHWMDTVPKPLWTFIGVAEILGGVGLLLPALTGILPWLTPLAGAGLALVMLLAMLFHAGRKEYPHVARDFVLFPLAAFVVYGRLALAPL